MEKMNPYIMLFEDIDKDQAPLVGGKNASLGEMTQTGIQVPQGFAVTTQAYKDFLSYNQLEKRIRDLLIPLKEGDVDQTEQASTQIREIIEHASVPEVITEEIEENYRRLWKRVACPLAPVAVRSSATAEDLPGASFAGQQETFLFVRKGEEVVKKVVQCWSSLFTPRAISYRIKMGFPHESVFISVGVQRMINAYTAGVMFTINPLNGDPSTIIINSNFGVGESVVSGEVTPDEFFVNKVTFEIVRRVVGPKEVYYVADKAQKGLIKKEQFAERQNVQSIVDEDIIELAKIGKEVEKHYGQPMDIEWAVEKKAVTKGTIFILQARPETVWSSKKRVEPVKGKVDVMGLIAERLKKGQKINL